MYITPRKAKQRNTGPRCPKRAISQHNNNLTHHTRTNSTSSALATGTPHSSSPSRQPQTIQRRGRRSSQSLLDGDSGVGTPSSFAQAGQVGSAPGFFDHNHNKTLSRRLAFLSTRHHPTQTTPKRRFFTRIASALGINTSLLSPSAQRVPEPFKYNPQMLQSPKEFEINHFLSTFNSRTDPVVMKQPQTMAYLEPTRQDYPFFPIGNLSTHHSMINPTLAAVGSANASVEDVGDSADPKAILRFITEKRHNAKKTKAPGSSPPRQLSRWEQYMQSKTSQSPDNDGDSDDGFDDGEYYDQKAPRGKITDEELFQNNHFHWNYDVDPLREFGMSFDVKGEYIFNHQPITNAPLTLHHLGPASTGRIAYLIADHPNRTNDWKLPYLMVPKHSVGEFWSDGNLFLNEQDERKTKLNLDANKKYQEDLYDATHPTYLNSKWIQIDQVGTGDGEESEADEGEEENDGQNVEQKDGTKPKKVSKKIKRSLDRLQFYKTILPHDEFNNYQRVHRAVHNELANYDYALHGDLVSSQDHEKNLLSYLKRVEKSLSPNRRGTSAFQHRYDQVWYPTTFNEPVDGVLTSFQYPLERGATPEAYPGFPFLPLTSTQRIKALKENAEAEVLAVLNKQERERAERDKKERMISSLQGQSPSLKEKQSDLKLNMVDLFTENITPSAVLSSIQSSQSKMTQNSQGAQGRMEGDKVGDGDDAWSNPFRHYTYENYLSEILPHQFRTQFHRPVTKAKDLIEIIKQNIAHSEARSGYLPGYATRQFYTAQFPLEYNLLKSPESQINALPQLHPRHKQQYTKILAPSESILQAILFHLSSSRVQYQFMPPHLLQAIGPSSLENLDPTLTTIKGSPNGPDPDLNIDNHPNQHPNPSKTKASIRDYFAQCIINNDDPKTEALLNLAPFFYNIQPGDHDRLLSHPFIPELFQSLRHFVYQHYNPIVFSPERDGGKELEIRLFSNFSVQSDPYLQSGWIDHLDKKIRNTSQTLDLFAPDGENHGAMSLILRAVLNKHGGGLKVRQKAREEASQDHHTEADLLAALASSQAQSQSDASAPFDVSTFNLVTSVLPNHPAFSPLTPDLIHINDFFRAPSQPAIIHGCVIDPETRDLVTAFTATYGSPHDPSFYGGLDGFTSELRLYEMLRGELGSVHSQQQNEGAGRNDGAFRPQLMSQKLSMGPDHQVPYQPDVWDLPGNIVTQSVSAPTGLSAAALGVGIQNRMASMDKKESR